MFHSAEPPLRVTLCHLLLILAGAIHITFGSYFIELGQYLRDKKLNDQQLFLDNLPLGTFVITVGIFMVFAGIGLRAVLTKKISTTGEIALWITNWLVCIFNFTVALLEIGQYVFQEQSFSTFGLALPTNSQFTVPYYLQLADGIFSFLLVFPATLYLVYLANYRLIDSELRNRLYIVAEPKQDKNVEITERQIAIDTE